MKIVKGESGIEFITMNRKEFKGRELIWFFMSILLFVVGFIGGSMIGSMLGW